MGYGAYLLHFKVHINETKTLFSGYGNESGIKLPFLTSRKLTVTFRPVTVTSSSKTVTYHKTTTFKHNGCFLLNS